MSGRYGGPQVLTDEYHIKVDETYREVAGNVSAMARLLGISRQAAQNRVRKAKEAGYLDDIELHDACVPSRDDYLEARTRKISAFQKKKSKGDWRKPVLARLTPEPFRLKVFGDPHLDSDGCNFELFEKHWLEMDAANRVYGICVGDWFNNWLRALGHLWKDETSAPSDAWLCLEYLMDQRGDALIAACSGNHDDWTHGPADPVDLLMKKYGVLYRKGAIRVALHWDGLDPMHWAIRHKWKGSSMYSAAHWGVRANREGWRDTLLIGGHIHQDEPRLVSHSDGFMSHVCQVSAFKEYDDYVDIHGFNGPKISPVWDLVIDPREPETSPDRVKMFWSSDKARRYLDGLA